jgi:hypothetical protein
VNSVVISLGTKTLFRKRLWMLLSYNSRMWTRPHCTNLCRSCACFICHLLHYSLLRIFEIAICTSIVRCNSCQRRQSFWISTNCVVISVELTCIIPTCIT